MTQHSPARVRTCPDCDGFPVVHIDAGTRHRDGSRATLRVNCPTCKGSGHTDIATPRRKHAEVTR